MLRLASLTSPFISASRHLATSAPLAALRDFTYGSEEGFGRKNEVRKESWIRKRRRRSLGGDYREERGLARNPSEAGPLLALQDWTYADGRQGVPS